MSINIKFVYTEHVHLYTGTCIQFEDMSADPMYRIIVPAKASCMAKRLSDAASSNLDPLLLKPDSTSSNPGFSAEA